MVGVKLLFVYYKTLKEELQNESKIFIAISIWFRNIFTQIYTVNVIAIIRAETLDWFLCLLYIDYFLFLIQGYTQIDLKSVILQK